MPVTLSVQKDIYGPDWPLGLITVATSGTPVGIMSLVDTTTPQAFAPSTFAPQPGTSATIIEPEYSIQCQSIIITAVKSVSPVVANVGALYLLRASVSGSGNKTDSGATVAIIPTGTTFLLKLEAVSRNGFSPYRYVLDADNSGDGALVTLVLM